jgi:ribosomal protein S7
MTQTLNMNKGNELVLNRLSKRIRKSGKRTVSDKLIVETANILKDYGYSQPYDARVKAIELIKPNVELRSQKKSGQSVQIPSAMTEYRQEGRAIRRLKQAAQDRKEGKKIVRAGGLNSKNPGYVGVTKGELVNSFSYYRAQEIRSILTGEGSLSISKRDTLHRRAVAQRSARRT